MFTFGTKTRQRVTVVLNMMKRLMIMKEGLGWSEMMNDMAAPHIHMITTLYTLIPMYFESFRAGMLTRLVSQARKQPKIW